MPWAAAAIAAALVAHGTQQHAEVRAVMAEAADRMAVIPPEAGPKQTYDRYYILGAVLGSDDLPFTTAGTVKLRRPMFVWMAVFERRPAGSDGGIHILRSRSEMPQVVHGGCRAVNLVADARTGETLSSWCNISEGPEVNGFPPRLPYYHRSGSPFF